MRPLRWLYLCFSDWLISVPLDPENIKLLEAAGKVKSVCTGADGAFFYMPESGDSYCGWTFVSFFFLTPCPCYLSVSPDTVKAYPQVTEINKSGDIQEVVFGQGGAYVVLGTKKDYATDPAILPENARPGHNLRIKCAALGVPGVWVVVDSDNTVRHSGVDERIITAIKAKPVAVCSPQLVTGFF